MIKIIKILCKYLFLFKEWFFIVPPKPYPFVKTTLHSSFMMDPELFHELLLSIIEILKVIFLYIISKLNYINSLKNKYNNDDCSDEEENSSSSDSSEEDDFPESSFKDDEYMYRFTGPPDDDDDDANNNLPESSNNISLENDNMSEGSQDKMSENGTDTEDKDDNSSLGSESRTCIHDINGYCNTCQLDYGNHRGIPDCSHIWVPLESDEFLREVECDFGFPLHEKGNHTVTSSEDEKIYTCPSCYAMSCSDCCDYNSRGPSPDSDSDPDLGA